MGQNGWFLRFGWLQFFGNSGNPAEFFASLGGVLAGSSPATGQTQPPAPWRGGLADIFQFSNQFIGLPRSLRNSLVRRVTGSRSVLGPFWSARLAFIWMSNVQRGREQTKLPYGWSLTLSVTEQRPPWEACMSWSPCSTSPIRTVFAGA